MDRTPMDADEKEFSEKLSKDNQALFEKFSPTQRKQAMDLTKPTQGSTSQVLPDEAVLQINKGFSCPSCTSCPLQKSE